MVMNNLACFPEAELDAQSSAEVLGLEDGAWGSWAKYRVLLGATGPQELQASLDLRWLSF